MPDRHCLQYEPIGKRLEQRGDWDSSRRSRLSTACKVYRSRNEARADKHRAVLQRDPPPFDIGYLSPVEFERKVRLA
jgi:hypothetical protein